MLGYQNPRIYRGAALVMTSGGACAVFRVLIIPESCIPSTSLDFESSGAWSTSKRKTYACSQNGNTVSRTPYCLISELEEAFSNSRCPSSTLLPFYFGVPVLKPNIKKKGTLIIKGLLGNLEFALSPHKIPKRTALRRVHSSAMIRVVLHLAVLDGH